MKRLVEDGGIQYFLDNRVSVAALGSMFNEVWKRKNSNIKTEDIKERLAREALLQYIAD